MSSECASAAPDSSFGQRCFASRAAISRLVAEPWCSVGEHIPWCSVKRLGAVEKGFYSNNNNKYKYKWLTAYY